MRPCLDAVLVLQRVYLVKNKTAVPRTCCTFSSSIEDFTWYTRVQASLLLIVVVAVTAVSSHINSCNKSIIDFFLSFLFFYYYYFFFNPPADGEK